MAETIKNLTTLPPAGAKFSECKNYRYLLWRRMDSELPMIAFVGLNPSRANADTNDNTIKKLIKITLNNGYGGLYMLNLFGVISEDPKILLTHPDPIGINEVYLKTVIQAVDVVVCCWGTFKQAHKTGRSKEVLSMIPVEKRYYLRLTKDGHPWHPLYCHDVEKIKKL